MSAQGQPDGEEGDAMKRVVMAAAALAVASAAPASAKEPYFAVKISATQDVTWTRDMTVQGCSDSIMVLTGGGEAHLRVHQRGNAWVGVKRIDRLRATLIAPVVYAAGSFSRKGELASHASTPPRDPGACPQAIPAVSDCGTLALPPDATLSLSYVPSKLTLTGPHSAQWFEGPFQHCPGVNGDDSLGATWYTNDVVQTGPAPLPLARVFGRRKHFALRWSDKRTVETARPGGIVLSGTYPVTTTIRWSIRFTRLAKPPQPELGVPEGL
jgi:hypothetical protein